MQVCEEAKVAVVGCGRVGMSVAFSLLHRDSIQELVLVSRDIDKLEGEKLDLDHGMPFLSATTVTATTDYAQLVDSDVVVFAAGAAQKPGQTRLDLISANKRIVSELLPQIVEHAPAAIIVMVTNPVDILTHHARVVSGLPATQVLGTGTMLDTARFRFYLSELSGVHPNSIHAYIIGEHGDHSVPAISSASIGGQKLLEFPGIDREKILAAYERARNAAYEIIEKKGSTYYAIGAVTSHLVDTILKNKHTIYPVSASIDHTYDLGIGGISLPAVIGRAGVERVIEVGLDQFERETLEVAARALQETYAQS